jgi:hypothetical protein
MAYRPYLVVPARRRVVVPKGVAFFERKHFDYAEPARDTSELSPYAVARQVGIPPAYAPPQDVVFIKGVPSVNGVPLGHGDMQGVGITAPPVTRKDSVPVYIDGNYGDSIIIPINIVANQPILALARPSNQRVMLLVQSQFAAGNMFYQFGKPADGFSSIAIIPFGNRLWDSSVPQGDLWLFSAVNGLAVIEYMNNNIAAVTG